TRARSPQSGSPPIPPARGPERLPEHSVQRSADAPGLDAARESRPVFPYAESLEDLGPMGWCLAASRSCRADAGDPERPPAGVARNARAMEGHSARAPDVRRSASSPG